LSSEDRLLVKHFLTSGEEHDFLLIYRKFSGSLFRLAMHLTGHNQALSSDILQDTWVTVVEKLAGFAWHSSLRTWITGIMINKFRESARKQQMHINLAEVDTQIVNPSSHFSKMDLKKAIDELSEGYRMVLILHDIEGFKHREIAVTLGITEGTSKSQLFQARKRMRALISDYQNERHD